VSGRLLKLQDSDGASDPRATVTVGPKNPGSRGDPKRLPPLFSFSSAVTPPLSAKKKTQQAVDFILFLVFQIFSSAFSF
jgi:hypothetical protein